jgi:hypothetical protein
MWEGWQCPNTVQLRVGAKPLGDNLLPKTLDFLSKCFAPPDYSTKN